MNFKVLKSAKFPLDLCKGSVQIREQKANKLTDKFFNEIKDEFVNGEISLKKIQKKISKSLPKKKSIIVESSKEFPFYGQVSLIPDSNFNLSKFIIRLPVNKFSKKVDAQSTHTMMHEFRHIANYLLNPKYTQRKANLFDDNKNFLLTKSYEFYKKEMYIRNKTLEELKNFKDNILYFLENKSSKEKINVLQNWRYDMYNEITAYKNGNLYQKKLESTHPKLFTLKPNPINYSKFHFKEKIKIIENILASTIKQERNSHKKSLNSVL